jgi:uncharacterized protein YbaP (TraB family)
MKRKLFRWFALFLSASAAGFAQTSPRNPPVKDWSIETVVVTAKASGPALWHISKGESDVWILGLVEPVPTNLKWDSRELGKLMDRSRVVLLPPRGQVGVFEGIWFLITSGDVLRLPDGQKLESILPEPLKGRFARARADARRDPDHYAEYKPSVAGFMLEADVLKSNKLTVREPVATIQSLAAQKIVPVRTIATYPALDVVKEVPSLSPAANNKCLGDSLDDVDVMQAHAKLAAEAWAIGDIDAIKEHYSEPKALDCLGQSASFTKLWQRSVDDTVGAVDTALKQRGRTVIVINIGELLRKNGVLERLKAQGLQIEGPGD